MATLYVATAKRFRDTVTIINNLELSTFQKEVLENLATRKDKEISEQYKEVAELVKHIVERAAQQQATNEQVVRELKGIIEEDRLKSLLRYYQLFNQQLLKKLERSPVVPAHLGDVHWRLHLQLAEDRKQKILSPTALFQFKLVNPEGEDLEHFNLEFEHVDLYDFFHAIGKYTRST